jgi:DNA modification methylase
METNQIYIEPCLETLKKMPDNFLDCVITSPPYWQLRDYGYEGQWGLEPTFNEYLENLWSMMDEIYRALKPTGTCWINLGDTYNTISGGIRGLERAKKNGATRSISKKNIIGQGFQQQKSTEVPNKCLLLIPHRFAIGCIDRGWIVRNDIVWAKRNAMPESCTDRFSKKHEYFFFMTKSEKYFFDLDAIRDKTITPPQMRNKADEEFGSGTSNFSEGERQWGSEKGKNPGSVSDFWDIPTKPSTSEHYASYNDELIRKPILAGCPEGGIVYDPFMGTGSTAEVCLRSKRLYIGSEMSDNYVKIANKRLEPFLMQQTLF